MFENQRKRRVVMFSNITIKNNIDDGTLFTLLIEDEIEENILLIKKDFDIFWDTLKSKFDCYNR